MNQTMAVKTETLKVPGAGLYYEVRGTGPVLLMIPGGPAAAAVFGQIATELASRYTVVTYDPRGLSRSRLDGPVDDGRILEQSADDAHRLIAAITDEPAFVFGNSGGAVIALELVRCHPEQVRALVAHEPPAPVLLEDATRRRAAMEEVVDTYHAAGIGPAMQKFMAAAGIRGGPPPAPQGELTPEMLEGMAQMERNIAFWLGHTFGAVANYEPDFPALRAASTRIVPAVGEESRGELAHEGGLGLATRLGTEVVVFPGAHGGFDSHAALFAVKLREVLKQ